MREFYAKAASAYFIAATLFLVLLAALLFLFAVWEAAAAVLAREAQGVLDSVGLLIIGFAVIETAKFVAEEEVLREKELRSATESRRSLTKFITIIVIAASLEALVMVFKTSRDSIPYVIYPAALLGVSMAGLVALGAFQWLSSRIAREPPGSGGEDGGKRDGAEAGE